MAEEYDENQFLDDVFPAELEEINARRRRRGAPEVDVRGGPSTDKGLVGLAFSGGGIRSATVNLGVVQALSRYCVLSEVDYLSTVSGGGYIGSCMSSLLADHPEKPPDGEMAGGFPLRTEMGRIEPPAVRHVRNSGKFLTPGGFLDRVRLFAMILRGTFLSFLVFVPLVMLAVLITEVLYEVIPWSLEEVFFWVILIEVVIIVLIVLAFPLVSRFFRHRFSWKERNQHEMLLAAANLFLFLTLLLIPLAILVGAAIEQPWDEAKAEFEQGQLLAVFGLPAYWMWLAPLILVTILVVSQSTEALRKMSRKVWDYIVGVAGPAIILFIYLFLCVYQVDSPFVGADKLRPMLDTLARQQGPVEAPSLLMRVLENRELIDHPTSIDNRTDSVTVIKQLKPLSVDLSEEKHLKERSIADSVWVVTVNSHPDNHYIVDVGSRLAILGVAGKDDPFDTGEDLWFFVILVGIIAFNFLFLDINTTSLHGFYRDRLSKAYMLRENPEKNGVLEANDTQKLSKLGNAAPYHLVNVVLNLQASKDSDLRGRMADFFIFSKRYVGSDRTGYVKTETMEKIDRHLDLAAAIAISGAAAAPNMGSTTVRSFSFLMTLLNLRLGYWLVNPRKMRKMGAIGRYFKNWPGPWLLLREAIGDLHERGGHVNLSDGGHIENLGLYELLKRRCKLIIAIDAGADPAMRFASLVALKRFAMIDMGVDLDINLDPLRPDESGFSRQHGVLGTIRYGVGETGYLLYVKSSMTGDENEFVRHYKSVNISYPHQSTADQFFDEEQFEAYRELGFHSTQRSLLTLGQAIPEEDVAPLVARVREVILYFDELKHS